MEERISAHVIVAGRVQGVCYRDFTRREACLLGVSGWVRNLSDGRVEALLEGEKDRVECVLQNLSEGPDAAEVAGMEVAYGAFRGSYSGFEIAADARRPAPDGA